MDTQQKNKLSLLHLDFDQFPDNANDALKQYANVITPNIKTQSELDDLLCTSSFDGIITKLGFVINESHIAQQPRLKFIASSTTGLNHIDVNAAQKSGIEIISLKGEYDFLASIKSTAEHTWLLILSILRNFVPAYKSVIEQDAWDRSKLMADELDGSTIGIIGYGRLGKILSTYAKAFGMKVLVNDIKDDLDSLTENTPLKELISQADVVVLMIDFNSENIGFWDESKFALMKPTAYFINTSRGELVNETDLIDALVYKKIKGAAVDVLNGDSGWTETCNIQNPLIKYAKHNSNLIITPHMGGYGKQSIYRTRLFISDKIVKYISIL